MKIDLNTNGKAFMKNGFTLIELLAVIVILAIIAVIAVPIVLNIINDSKKSTTLQSAEFYIDALQNKIMQKNIENGGTFIPSECTVDENGNVTCDETYLEIEMKGNKPNEGKIKINNGKITEVTLKFENETITMNEDGKLQFGTSSTICKLKSGYANTVGSKYECEVKNGTKYNFYVISIENDGTTNLIMERNICEDGRVATSNDTCLVSWNANGNSSNGPVTAMTYLTKATSTWENISNLDMTYDDESNNFTGFRITGKARLPRYDEIHGQDKCLMYHENNEQYGSCPIWLVNYLNVSTYYTSTVGKIDIAGVWGYWTLSSYSGIDNSALHVHYYGDVGAYSIELTNHLGIRPVINVKL